MGQAGSSRRERSGRRTSRLRRLARSVAQTGRRRGGRGGVQGERARDIVRELNPFRRRR
jgi:hypothetical protein